MKKSIVLLVLVLVLPAVGVGISLSIFAALLFREHSPQAIIRAGALLGSSAFGLGLAFWVLAQRDRIAELRLTAANLKGRIGLLDSRIEEQRGRLELLAAIREISLAISSNVDFAGMAGDVLRITQELTGATDITLFTADEETGEPLPRARRQDGEVEFFEGRAADDIDGKPVQECMDLRTTLRAVAAGYLTFYVPLAAEAEVLGALSLTFATRRDRAEAEAAAEKCEEILKDLARHIALSLKASRLHDRAVLDGLTGIYSKRHFDAQLQAYFELARRHGSTVSLILFDVDKFKEINDVHGHLSGDLVLIAIAQLVEQTIRKYDSAYRYGGDEFAVLLPESDESAASRMAERLRKAVGAKTFRGEKKKSVKTSLSIGVAAYDPSIHEPEELLSRADKALYAAKKAGHNRVEAWSALASPP